MTKERTFVDVCEDYVRIYEQTELEFLAFMATCSWFDVEKWCELFAAEDWRLNVWTPDQEEEQLMNWAIQNKLLKDNNE